MFKFTIVAAGIDPHAVDFEDRFFEAGCDDATIVLHEGNVILDFSRASTTLQAAVASAISDVRRAGARVERIAPRLADGFL